MKNLKISTRLIILVSISSLLTLLIGLYGVNNLGKVNAGTNTMYEDRVLALEQLKRVSDSYAVNIVDATHKMRNGNMPWTEGVRGLETAKKTIDEYYNAYAATKIDGEELTTFNQAKEFKSNADAAYNELMSIVTKEKDSVSMAMLDKFVINVLYSKIDPLTGKISELIDIQTKISKDIYEESAATYSTTRNFSYGIIIIGVLLSILFAYFIITNINASLKTANEVIMNLTDGDLTQNINQTSKDEIGILLENIGKFNSKLKEIVENIIVGSNSIADASNAMSSSSQEMSQGTQEQAASAEEISSSMEQMASNIQQNTDNAMTTEKTAIKAAEDIKEGSSAVNQTVDSMKKIADKIGIIGEIARQTNLLALNAAVEAARAGDHGKGFAVVAAEVRKLAERSQLAAEEIDTLSKNSVAVADRSGKLLEQIVPNIQNTAKLVQEISASSTEQSNGAEQVNTSIQQFNQVIQQNAAGAEEIASSSEELAAQAESLRDAISFFKLEKQVQSQSTFNKTKKVVKSVNTTHAPVSKYSTSKSAVKNGTPGKNGAIIELDGNDHLDNKYEKFK